MNFWYSLFTYSLEVTFETSSLVEVFESSSHIPCANAKDLTPFSLLSHGCLFSMILFHNSIEFIISLDIAISISSTLKALFIVVVGNILFFILSTIFLIAENTNHPHHLHFSQHQEEIF